jgi:hypothetical protein
VLPKNPAIEGFVAWNDRFPCKRPHRALPGGQTHFFGPFAIIDDSAHGTGVAFEVIGGT